MSDVKIVNVRGVAKYSPGNLEVIRAPNRGYYDVAKFKGASFDVRMSIGETVSVGKSETPGMKTIPEWALKALTGGIEGTEPSPILMRAVREGIIRIEGDAAALKRIKDANKAYLGTLPAEPKSDEAAAERNASDG